MQKKHLLVLLLVIGLFTHNKAQQTKGDSLSAKKAKFVCGIKANGFNFMRLPSYNGGGNQDLYFGTDCSAYLQYHGFGVFGGYTALYNFSNGLTHTNIVMNCVNYGAYYKFFQINKTSAITLYFYNVHYSMPNPLYQPEGFYNGVYHPLVYNKETIDFIIANPRYTGTFCKDILSVEFGVFFSVFRDNIIGGFNIGADNSYPAIGTNAAVALNVSALFAKKIKLPYKTSPSFY